MTPSPLSDDRRTLLAELYTLHGAPVMERLQLRYRTADPDIIADALIEALMRVLECDLHCIRDMRIRITREARCRLRSKFRSNSRQKDREKKYTSDLVTDRGLGGPSPDDEASDRELAAAYRRCLARTCEETLVLESWLNGLTDAKEIAMRCHIDHEEAVRILSRLRQRIKRLRDEEGQS